MLGPRDFDSYRERWHVASPSLICLFEATLRACFAQAMDFRAGSGRTLPIAWAPVDKLAGTLYLTLNGAANGGTASSINWSFNKTNGKVVRTGSVTC